MVRPELDSPILLQSGAPGFLPFSHGGDLLVKVGTSHVPIVGGTFAIDSVAAMVNTAPTGAAVILDVNRNDVSIYPTPANRPTIAPGSRVAAVGQHVAASLTDGDFLSVDIDQVGSGVAGADLVLMVRLRSI